MGLDLRQLRVSLRGQVLAEVSAHIAPATVLTVMGPSGSGKSTLLAAVIGATVPEFTVGGQILLQGRDVTHLPTAQRRIGLLFQDDVLFPHLSVAGNLGFGLPARIARPQRRAVIEDGLAQMDLQGFADRDPATLSGGQRARVALLRTLLAEPKALLLDEPFSRLDLALRDQIRSLVFAAARNRGLPVILVTHDPADAAAAGGAVISPMGLQL
jgi:putative thiamine transport system ATP-binding protein